MVYSIKKQFFILGIIFFLCFTVMADAQTVSNDTSEKFISLINENNGETIILSNDIYWDERSQDFITAQRDINIDMNGHSIILEDNASLMMNGPIHFTGNGQTEPLFVLGEHSRLRGENGVTISAIGAQTTAVRMSNLSALTAELVSAQGDDCVAVLINGNEEEVSSVSVAGDVIAKGMNSSAIKTTGDIALYMMSFSASGENSAAVRTDGNIYCFFSEVEGQDILADTEGEIVFDACKVNTKQENAVYITRTAFAETVSIASLSGEDYELPEYIEFSFEVNETEYDGYFSSYVNSVYRNPIKVKWDMSQSDSLEPGIYTATATQSEYTDFESISFEPVLADVTIVEKLPEIMRAYYVFQDLVLKFDVQIPKSITFKTKYSTDEGENWNCYSEAYIDDSQSTITLKNFGELTGDKERSILFAVSFMLQTGETETEAFEFTGKPPEDDGGGDRDGGDQGDQGEWESGAAKSEQKEKSENVNSDEKSEIKDENKLKSLAEIFKPVVEAFRKMDEKLSEGYEGKQYETENTSEKPNEELSEIDAVKPENISTENKNMDDITREYNNYTDVIVTEESDINTNNTQTENGKNSLGIEGKDNHTASHSEDGNKTAATNEENIKNNDKISEYKTDKNRKSVWMSPIAVMIAVLAVGILYWWLKIRKR